MKKTGYALLGTLIVALLHLWPGKSMFTYASALDAPGACISVHYLDEVVKYHQTHPSFVTRPATTQLILVTAGLFSVSPGQAFIVVSLVLFFAALYGLLEVTRLLYGSVDFLTMLVYTFSFSILFAWFPNVYTYDEPLQYTLLFLSVALLLRNWPLMALLAFAAAVYVRENSLFLLPGFCWVFRDRLPTARLRLLWAAPVLCVLALLLKKISTPEGAPTAEKGLFSAERIEHLFYNFQDFAFGTETVFSLMLALVLPLAFLLRLRGKPTAFIQAFVFSLLINTVMVVLFGRARETRLFALPLIFVWPLIHSSNLSFEKPVHFFSKQNSLFYPITGIFLIMATLAYFLSLSLYQPTETQNEKTFQIYSFIALLLFSGLSIYPKRKTTLI